MAIKWDEIQARWDNWFPRVEKADQDLLVRMSAYTNLIRLRILAWGIIVIQAGAMMLQGVLVGSWADLKPFAYGEQMVAVRLVSIGVSLVFLFAFTRPASPAETGRRHHVVETAYLTLMLLCVAVQTALFQTARPVITAYLIGLFGAVTFLRLRGFQSLLAFGLAWLALALNLWYLQPDASLRLTHLINSGFLTILALLISRITFLTWGRDLLNRRVIEQQTAELERLSFIDGLTGVSNRRYLDQSLLREWRRAAREGQPLALIMVDIDHFKLFNDTYGHQAGDDCLKAVAQALGRCLRREGDTLARFGGEEFAVVLPNTDSQGAWEVAEHMRQQVQGLGLENAATERGRLTISLGAASLKPTPQESPEVLVAAADRALYRAKDAGRNQSVLAGQGQSG